MTASEDRKVKSCQEAGCRGPNHKPDCQTLPESTNCGCGHRCGHETSAQPPAASEERLREWAEKIIDALGALAIQRLQLVKGPMAVTDLLRSLVAEVTQEAEARVAVFQEAERDAYLRAEAAEAGKREAVADMVRLERDFHARAEALEQGQREAEGRARDLTVTLRRLLAAYRAEVSPERRDAAVNAAVALLGNAPPGGMRHSVDGMLALMDSERLIRALEAEVASLKAELARQSGNVERLVAAREAREKNWQEGMDALLERNSQLTAERDTAQLGQRCNLDALGDVAKERDRLLDELERLKAADQEWADAVDCGGGSSCKAPGDECWEHLTRNLRAERETLTRERDEAQERARTSECQGIDQRSIWIMEREELVKKLNGAIESAIMHRGRHAKAQRRVEELQRHLWVTLSMMRGTSAEDEPHYQEAQAALHPQEEKP